MAMRMTRLRQDLEALLRPRVADAFARAWFKLTHRDSTETAHHGKLVPKETLIWGPDLAPSTIDAKDADALKVKILAGLRCSNWLRRPGLASTFRGSDNAAAPMARACVLSAEDGRSTSR